MVDVVVCLGKKVRGAEGDIELLARVKKAVDIWRFYKCDYIIFSGGYTGGDLSEAVVMQKIASQLGVPKKSIILEEESTNTVENVVYVKEIIDNLNPNHIYVVTSPYHLMRTKLIFEKLVGRKGMIFVASSYPYNFEDLLSHLIGETIRLLRILIFGIYVKKKRRKNDN